MIDVIMLFVVLGLGAFVGALLSLVGDDDK